MLRGFSNLVGVLVLMRHGDQRHRRLRGGG